MYSTSAILYGLFSLGEFFVSHGKDDLSDLLDSNVFVSYYISLRIQIPFERVHYAFLEYFVRQKPIIVDEGREIFSVVPYSQYVFGRIREFFGDGRRILRYSRPLYEGELILRKIVEIPGIYSLQYLFQTHIFGKDIRISLQRTISAQFHMYLSHSLVLHKTRLI